MKLPIIPQDKANHALYGLLIYFLAQFFVVPIISLVVVIIIAVAKEVYDIFSKKGTPEGSDCIATVLGALPLFLQEIIKC